ncbi:MAG: AAA family ATPase [Candidatus Peribacteraceae bacterium]|nr:AAA family ATPase [Candidatus Peribacteraceae bacterium]
MFEKVQWEYEEHKGFKIRFEKIDKEDEVGEVRDKQILITDEIILNSIIETTHDMTWRYNGREWKNIAIFPRMLKSLKSYATDMFDDDDVDEEASKLKLIVGFCNYIEETFPFDEILKEAKTSGHIPSFLVPYYIEEGAEIFWKDDEGELRGGEVLSVEERSSFFEGRYFSIKVKYIYHDGEEFCYYKESVKMTMWDGGRKFEDLKVQLMNDEVKEILTKRGGEYKAITEKASYVQYKGDLARSTWWTTLHFKADGRIMVDRANMKKVDSDYFNSYARDRDDDDNSISILHNELFWMCESTIYGFSFAIKKWGEFKVSATSAIQYDTEAFHNLVLAEDKKSMILALVNNYKSGFSDIISGKGGGCIFLLHGKPGCGKTLTAEAVAEVLKKPLYSVTIGELGIDPDQLEERLRQVLEMAEIWDAVLLLDEADIFMEERTSEDVHRNAMVGIFLRLLEYHQGVLFLTTNRAKNIDKAMRSRISIPLYYEDHKDASRTKIWENLIGAAKLATEEIDIKTLATKDLNGRQIKSTIRMAQAIAAQNKEVVKTEHLMSYIELLKTFEKQMSNGT